MILLECAKYVLRFHNQTSGWSPDAIKDTFERVFNETQHIVLEVTEANDD